MRQMSLGMNIFCGNPSFVDKKKMDRKKLFGELCTEDSQEIRDNAVPLITKKPLSSQREYSTVRIR